MSARIRKDLSDESRKVIEAGPWFISINRKTRLCEVTSGDLWFPIPRHEAAQLILRQLG